MPLAWDTLDAETVRPEEAYLAESAGFWANATAADEAFTLSGLTTSEQLNLANAYDPIIAALNAERKPAPDARVHLTEDDAFANPFGRSANDPHNGDTWRWHRSPEDLEERIWRAVAERRKANSEAFKDLPADRQALDGAIAQSVRSGEQAAEEVRARANGLGVVGAIAGTLFAGLKDPVTLATMPMGLPMARSVVGVAIAEAGLGAATMGLIVPATNDYREAQGLHREDVSTAMLWGAAGGGVLGGLGKAAGRMISGESARAVADSIARDLNPVAQWRAASALLGDFRVKVKDPTPAQRGAAAVLERQAFVEETNPGPGDLIDETFHAELLDDMARAVEADDVGKAYDAVLANPAGTAEDPLVRITPAEVEGSILARGGFKGKGDITIKGSGWGLVKVQWRHGARSSKAAHLQVSREDVVRFPSVIRDFEPLPATDGQRRWVVSRDDGRQVVYVDRAFAEDAKRRVVSIHVMEEPRANLPLSKKRNAGAVGSPDGRSQPAGDTTAGSLKARPPAGPAAPVPKNISPPPPSRKALPPALRAPRGGKPQSLGTWLARQGGIDDSLPDYQGWLRRLDGHRRRPGLVNTRAGMTLDDAALKAWEAGYFPAATDRPAITDLLDALDDDLRGVGRYRSEDMAAAQQWTEWQARVRDIEALGIHPAGMTDAQLEAAISTALGRQAWDRVAPTIPITDDMARAITGEARAAGRDLEDVASDKAEAVSMIFEGGAPWESADVPFDTAGDVARIAAVADETADRWRQAEIIGLQDPEATVPWQQIGSDGQGRPIHDQRSAEEVFALLDDEDSIAASVAVCVGGTL